MLRILTLLILLFLSPVTSRANGFIDNNLIVDTVATPRNYIKLAQAFGDLDKDNKDELVIVFDTGRAGEMGTERELCIYKKASGIWKFRKKFAGVVLPSRHGGTMGDPFQKVKIERGCIVIDHFGGSREKWSYTHRYRFQQNQWCLIGATINFGAQCDYFWKYDYNLSTGKIAAVHTTEKCDDNDKIISDTNEKFSFSKPVQKPVLMDSFVPGETLVKVTKGAEFYY